MAGSSTTDSSQPLPTLLFDGDCGFCQNWVSWARARGAASTVRFAPCQAEDRLRAAARIDLDECGRTAMLVETGPHGEPRVRRRARAINGVLRRLPGPRNALLRMAGLVGNLPILAQLEDIAYRVLARNRHRLSTTCRINPD